MKCFNKINNFAIFYLEKLTVLFYVKGTLFLEKPIYHNPSLVPKVMVDFNLNPFSCNFVWQIMTWFHRFSHITPFLGPSWANKWGGVEKEIILFYTHFNIQHSVSLDSYLFQEVWWDSKFFSRTNEFSKNYLQSKTYFCTEAFLVETRSHVMWRFPSSSSK